MVFRHERVRDIYHDCTGIRRPGRSTVQQYIALQVDKIAVFSRGQRLGRSRRE